MKVSAEYKCVKQLCGYEWKTPQPIHATCPKCGSLYVYWTNYYSWKWNYFDLSFNIKTRKYYKGEEEIMDSNLPFRTI